MLKIFFDTDIGGDSDDAGALSLLCNLSRAKQAEIVGAASTTTRRGAADCIRAIAEHYGVRFPVGELKGEPFLGDEDGNIYAGYFDRQGGEKTEDSVRVFRRAVSGTQGKIRLVAVGPLKNVALYLKSKGDDLSDMDGISLFREKVEALYIMGGCFADSYYAGNLVDVEYNIVQDIPSAQYVTEHCPCPVYFSPFELGNRVFTGKNVLKEEGHPAGECYRRFNLRWNASGERQSWDPITAYFAATDGGGLLTCGKAGKVTILPDGKSVFREEEKGRHFIILPKVAFESISEELNRWIE